MRILFIVPYVPSQIRVRPYSLLKTLVERDHQVTLATLWSSPAERAELESLETMGLDSLSTPLPRAQSLFNCLKSLPSTTPLQAVYCWQPHLLTAIKARLRTQPYDVIHVEHLRGARYGLALQETGIPIVWDSVDCISYLFEQAVVHSQSLFGKWMTRLELGRTRQYEGWLAHQFDRVLVTSAVDRQALLRLAQQQAQKSAEPGDRLEARLIVLPNGVDQTYFRPNGQSPEPETILLSGKMSYHANVTMAHYLVGEIMPHVWAERPGVQVKIVGKDPPASVQQFGADARVTVTGYVPDMRPYLRQATVAVVPSAYGAGIQNKVLEAMACGTPVVAMERATTALSLEPERDLLVAEEAEPFARQVLRLLNDTALRQSVGLNGLRYIQRAHSWPHIGATLEEIYRAAIQTRADRFSQPALR